MSIYKHQSTFLAGELALRGSNWPSGENKMCFPHTSCLSVTFSMVCTAGSTFSGSGDQVDCYKGGHQQCQVCG